MTIWQKRREMEASKISERLEKRISRYQGYVDRLERKAGSQFQSGDEGIFYFCIFFSGFHSFHWDTPPDSIDSFYDELEYPDGAACVFSRIKPIEAGWLARYTRKQIDLSRERMGDEIEQELKVRISVIFNLISNSNIILIDHMSSTWSALLPNPRRSRRTYDPTACESDSPANSLECFTAELGRGKIPWFVWVWSAVFGGVCFFLFDC